MRTGGIVSSRNSIRTACQKARGRSVGCHPRFVNHTYVFLSYADHGFVQTLAYPAQPYPPVAYSSQHGPHPDAHHSASEHYSHPHLQYEGDKPLRSSHSQPLPSSSSRRHSQVPRSSHVQTPGRPPPSQPMDGDEFASTASDIFQNPSYPSASAYHENGNRTALRSSHSQPLPSSRRHSHVPTPPVDDLAPMAPGAFQRTSSYPSTSAFHETRNSTLQPASWPPHDTASSASTSTAVPSPDIPLRTVASEAAVSPDVEMEKQGTWPPIEPPQAQALSAEDEELERKKRASIALHDRPSDSTKDKDVVEVAMPPPAAVPETQSIRTPSAPRGYDVTKERALQNDASSYRSRSGHRSSHGETRDRGRSQHSHHRHSHSKESRRSNPKESRHSNTVESHQPDAKDTDPHPPDAKAPTKTKNPPAEPTVTPEEETAFLDRALDFATVRKQARSGVGMYIPPPLITLSSTSTAPAKQQDAPSASHSARSSHSTRDREWDGERGLSHSHHHRPESRHSGISLRDSYHLDERDRDSRRDSRRHNESHDSHGKSYRPKPYDDRGREEHRRHGSTHSSSRRGVSEHR